MLSRLTGMSHMGGKSRGCDSCKRRKIKCDLTRPACNRCLKSGWTCPGYPTSVPTVFRHQTVSIVQKLRVSLSPSTTDRATTFFLSQYVLQRYPRGSKSISRGHYDYIPALLQGQSENSVLATTVAAAGLAGLANAGNSNTWRIDAHRLHGLAIKKLKDALEDPEQAIGDRVLLAIILMGTFEQIASADANSMNAFGQHILAVAKCLELRGPSQFQTAASVGLLADMRRLVIMTLHRLQEPIPPALRNWSTWAQDTLTEDEAPANAFSELSTQLLAARAEIKRHSITDPTAVAEILIPVDEKLQKWRSNLPQLWQYKTYTALDSNAFSNDTWDSQHDVYEDIWVASCWNNYRTSRLLLHEHILSTALASGPSTSFSVLIQSSAKVLNDMVDEICHSVPFYLGTSRNVNPNSPGAEGIPGCYTLIWPLFASGMRRTTPWEQKQWIAEKLRYIGGRMGLRLAMSMAERVKMEKKPTVGAEISNMADWYPKQ